jgi:hypothetical protein
MMEVIAFLLTRLTSEDLMKDLLQSTEFLSSKELLEACYSYKRRKSAGQQQDRDIPRVPPAKAVENQVPPTAPAEAVLITIPVNVQEDSFSMWRQIVSARFSPDNLIQYDLRAMQRKVGREVKEHFNNQKGLVAFGSIFTGAGKTLLMLLLVCTGWVRSVHPAVHCRVLIIAPGRLYFVK